MLMSKLNSTINYKQTINHKNNFNKHSIKDELKPLKTRPVKELITTADQGAGVVDDVDELLTPMHSQSFSVSPKPRTETRPERNLWAKAEMLEMLRIMSENNAMEKINDKMIRSDYVFRDIEEIMHANGYRKKSFTQIWTKWKFLKSTYNTTKRSGTVPKMIPVEVYEKLCQLLEGYGDSSNCGDGSVGVSNSDCGNSMQSMEEDENSNDLNTKNGLDANNCQQNGQVKPDNDLTMAHPIFGYRLGIVKAEPADTGYETVVNNDSNLEPDPDPLGYNQFHETNNVNESYKVDVKQELVENNDNTPPPTAPASPTPPPLQHFATPPPFGRARAIAMAKSQASLTPTPLCSSTPQQQQQQQKLASLRVAQFAKESTHIKSATSGVLKIERPPLQLPMKASPNAAATTRLNNNNNVNGNSNTTFVQPPTKLMLPKLQQQQQQSSAQCAYMRYPKEMNMQSASMLRLKQVPMRKTPYSLRPERMIPDLEQSNSPPPSPMPTINAVNSVQNRYGVYDNGAATTSRQAQIRMLNERKRRLGYETPHPVPIKLQRNSQMPRLVQQQQQQQRSHNNNSHNATKQEEESDSDEDEEVDKKPLKLKQEEAFENELKKLSDAMRETQHNMMLDFFRQQKEFARQEHDFQTKQDITIMRAFRKQTEHLTKLAKDLLGVDYKSAAKQTAEEVKLKEMLINGTINKKEPDYKLHQLETQPMATMESSCHSANNSYGGSDGDDDDDEKAAAAEKESYENDEDDFHNYDDDDAHNNNSNNNQQQNEVMSGESDNDTEESFDEMLEEAVPEIILET